MKEINGKQQELIKTIGLLILLMLAAWAIWTAIFMKCYM
jgi:hypothetical protein